MGETERAQLRHILWDGSERGDMAGYCPPEGFSDTARRLFQELVRDGEEMGKNDQNECE